MIEWKKFNPQTAPDELDEDDFLILSHGHAYHATHDAMNRYFSRSTDEAEIVYPYREITHYAEMNWPEEDTPMIDWCEHGNLLVCEECAKRHQTTE